jgi:hypothetical protein
MAALGRAASLARKGVPAPWHHALLEANTPRRRRVQSRPRATTSNQRTGDTALPLGSELVSFSMGQGRAKIRWESEGLLSLYSIATPRLYGTRQCRYTSVVCQVHAAVCLCGSRGTLLLRLYLRIRRRRKGLRLLCFVLCVRGMR